MKTIITFFVRRLLILCFFLVFGQVEGWTQVWHTESFENATAGQATFTSNGKSFSIISSSTLEPGGFTETSDFKIQGSYPSTGFNGTINDHKYIDNDSTNASTNPGFSIKTTDGSKIQIQKFYLFLSDFNTVQVDKGTVQIIGKLGGREVFTVDLSDTHNYVQSLSTNNGYTLIDLVMAGGVNNSLEIIDELEIKATSPFNYIGLDALTWRPAYFSGPTVFKAGKLTPFASCANVNSAEQSFDVYGELLSGPVTLSGNVTYEYSLTSGSGFTNNLFIPAIGNTVSKTTVYVRTVVAAVTSSGNLTLGSTGATNKNIPVAATLTPLPSFSVQPTNPTVCAGSNSSLSTTVANASGGLRWEVNTGSGFTAITDGGVYSGASTAGLSITGATAGMNGYQYRLSATNSCGTTVSTVVTLMVNVAPSISAQPTNSTTLVGTNTTFTATVANATGYQWQVDQGSGFSGIADGGVYSGATTATLTITGATVGMNGYKYRLVANGACTPGVTSSSGMLTVVTNQPPVISNLNGDAVTYTERGAAVAIDATSNATVTDSDSPDFDGGNVRVVITANRVGAEDVLSIRNQGTGAGLIGVSGSNVTYEGTTIGTWTGGTGTNDLVISLNSAATPAVVQALLRNLMYINTNTTDPSTLARTIAVTINDGDGGTSTPANVTVQITAINDAPTLTATAINPTFTEGASAVSLFSGTTISTIEAGQAISKLTLTVANVSDGNQEILKIDGFDVPLVSGTKTTGTNGLTLDLSVTGSSVTVQLSKVGGISPAIMQDVVNGITYRNASANPNTANRVITLSSIQDNGGTTNGGVDMTTLSIASTVSVVAVNDAPIVTTSGGNTTYTEGTAAVVDAALTVSDPDNTTLASATVAITGNFQSGQDVLEFANSGTTMGNITAGPYNNATGVLTLSSAGATATLAQWQSALSAVKYDNSSQNPSTANRTINFKVHDGGKESVAATKTVSVIAVNDAPVAMNDSYSVDEDRTLIVQAPGVLENDTDVEGDALTAIFVTGPSNGSLTLNADGSFTYVPSANFNGTDTFTYKVSDGNLFSNIATVTITVNPVNDAPVVTVPVSIAVTEDVATALKGISFSDVDAGTNSVTVTFSVPTGTLSAPSGMGITVGGTAAILTLSGSVSDINAFIAAGAVTFTTASNATSNVTLTVSINDNGHTGGTALSDSKTTPLLVTAVNDAPVNSVPGAQSVDQDATLVFNSANSNMISISDVDAGSSDVQVNLVATNGRMTLGSTSGLLFSVGTGTNDASLTFKGTIVNINNALNGLVFRPTPGYNGPASLQIITDDLGNSGSGGAKTDTDNIAITVNSISPKVISVSASTANGTYKVDDVIALTVTFDQTVMVNTGGGIPTLLLETGAIDRMSTYVSGDGSNTLTFNYTVQSGDISADLDYQSTAALSLNGSSIKNIHDDVAILTLPTVGSSNSIAGQRAIVIDGVVPTVTSVAVPTNGYYLLNQNLDFTVNFSEAVLVNTVGGTPRLSLTIGGQTAYANYLSGSGSPALVFRYVVVDGLEDHDGIAVGALSLNGGTIRDAAGNNAVLTLNSVGNTTGVKVDTRPPAVPATFTAIGQNGQVSLAWSANMEPDFEKYILSVKPEGGVKTHLTDVVKGIESYTYAGLPNGKTYEFYLVAVDQIGNTSAEALASAKTMGEQSISFAALANLTYGQQGVVLTASATSNLAVSFVSSDPNIAEVYQDSNDGGKWKVNAKKVGTVTITATQTGNNEYLPALSVSQSLTIVPAILTVTADAKTKVYGESDPVLTYTVKASDLRNGDVASVVTGKVSRIAGEDVGSYTIGQGNLSAGGNYNIRYVGADLKITKATLSGLKFVNKEVVYDGTAKSIQLDGKLPIGVTVSYQNNDKINAGRYEVKAVIAETPNYFGETFTATLLIRKAKQTITFMTPEVLGRDAGKVALDVQSNSGLPVTLTGDDPMVATVSGTELHVHRLGTVHITAMQSGNENYEAASPVTVSVRVANDASAPLPIRVHQALSPNGDGINEFLIIEGIRDYTDNKVTIFDKNGSVLAEIEGYDNRDKVFFGRDHRDGTYFYYIDLKDNGVWKREKGYFVIRR
ncbi:tandem-95 repeat protein [Sphingobacterium tabacisoli]|uniref:Tandem-95 repeat protein n=1 Tax=Sphingobacterium tabacisoli TaxID=2044855 RepID=A0ABW5L8W3_9SPHI|nr:tandem-95 repeat protein [Sphingobacterium tabacisoli]